MKQTDSLTSLLAMLLRETLLALKNKVKHFKDQAEFHGKLHSFLEVTASAKVLKDWHACFTHSGNKEELFTFCHRRMSIPRFQMEKISTSGKYLSNLLF